jgi:hypothetical protein
VRHFYERLDMTRIFRLAVFLVVFALRPAVASAQIEYIWEWLEQMSGPGPWNFHSGEVRLFCALQTNLGALTAKPLYDIQAAPDCWQDDSRVDLKGYLSVRGGFGYTNGLFEDNHAPLFADDPADTRRAWAVKFEPLLMARLAPAIDVGGGIGFMSFYGSGFSFARLVTTPVSVLISPGALYDPGTKNSRWIKIRYEMYYFPKGISGRDFGNTTTRYITRSEWTHSVGFVVSYSR